MRADLMPNATDFKTAFACDFPFSLPNSSLLFRTAKTTSIQGSSFSESVDNQSPAA